MKKKIISYSSYQKLRAKWQKEIGSNSKVHRLSNKLYTLADKNNYSYLYSWNEEPLLQNPEDLIVLQEIISKYKPQVIVELGVAWGGSILYLESLAKTFSSIKKIVGIDIFITKDLKKRLKNKISKKTKLIEDDTCSDKVKSYLLNLKKNYKRFLIHLDSDHSEKHVLKELKFYSNLLSVNDYLIVGDTIIDYIPKQKHRPRPWKKGNSPKSALDKFLKISNNKKIFQIDTFLRGKQLMTNNPNGYLKKIK